MLSGYLRNIHQTQNEREEGGQTGRLAMTDLNEVSINTDSDFSDGSTDDGECDHVSGTSDERHLAKSNKGVIGMRDF